MKKPLLTSILILVFLVLLLGAIIRVGPGDILGDIVMSLTEDTAYSPGYSEGAFQKISVRDTEASVVAALGKPLDAWDADPYTEWLYAPDPHPGFHDNGDYPDMRYSFTTIRFNEQGNFVEAFGQVSHGTKTGLIGVSASMSFGDGINTLSITKADIEKLKAEKATSEKIESIYGKPRSVFESRVIKWLQYSHSPGSKNYRKRLIGVDRSGKVCRAVNEFYWD